MQEPSALDLPTIGKGAFCVKVQGLRGNQLATEPPTIASATAGLRLIKKKGEKG